MRSCQQLGLTPVVVYTEPDALSLHVLEAEIKVCLGSSPQDYTNIVKLVDAAVSTGCVACHPGYGFLSEDVGFLSALEESGVAFLGPTADTMRMFSRKHTARQYAQEAGIPVLPGSTLLTTEEEAVTQAEATGFPVLLKATGGGGGIGIYQCADSADVRTHFAAAQRQGKASFGDSGVFVEKYVESARHIEVQIFGDGRGHIVTLPERECSIQRRHQKIIEETPSPFVEDALRQKLMAAARQLGKRACYRSAGTVEFLVEQSSASFYFLEVNTRLQVEHGITEMVTGIDLVDWQVQLQVPGLSPPNLTKSAYTPSGWAIEARINAEVPSRDFAPSSGILGHVAWPSDARVDTWVETGTELLPFFDSLLAKVMVHGSCRQDAVVRLQKALLGTSIGGVSTNLEYLGTIAHSKGFAAGATTTRFLEALSYCPKTIEVLEPGLSTTLQDYPGRIKLWHVGIPPSGPMDARAFRLANALVGNPKDAAGLEITLSGPTLKFHVDSLVALAGPEFPAEIDGTPVPFWTSILVKATSVLTIGTLSRQKGARCFLAVAGGIQCPVYLGSRATFPAGKFGGMQGRPLLAGDLLPLTGAPFQAKEGLRCPKEWVPKYPAGDAAWEVGVLPGPNAAPDFFTQDDINTLHSTTYTVHHNSNRLGVRLLGPRPRFARGDGGEGGSHPSNVPDHIYALGTINFTGDMPIVLTQDGPSFGGFVCPCTVTSTELWKIGQLSPNDRVRFKLVSLEDAYRECVKLDQMVEMLRSAAANGSLDGFESLSIHQVSMPEFPETRAVLKTLPASESFPGAQYRLAGDRYVFVEYGPLVIDINLCVRVHELRKALEERAVPGIMEFSPAVRSCMIEYDQRVISLSSLLRLLEGIEADLPPAGDQILESRILHLPMAFDDKWTRECISRYMRSARQEAPYLPSNIDFVAKNNGLAGGADSVKELLEKATYLVLGLGDVYLGCPIATAIDPRHRLIVPKYNPARTYTPEGTVSFGGSFMAIYPMESPGGYQLVGRSLPIWNTFGRVGPFAPAKPWLFETFDQIKFDIVSEAELEKLRLQFQKGQLQIRIEPTTFDMREYNAFVGSVAEETKRWRQRQAAAMAEQLQLDEESLQRLQAASRHVKAHEEAPALDKDISGVKISSSFAANVWEVRCKLGDTVSKGQILLVLEAMKMEHPISAPIAGQVKAIFVEPSMLTQQGDTLVIVEAIEK
ncbi:g6371 [Coccomyxa viridis]|uniref:G6371 protein n=1 Tax=Coccomyxa viridis TaxID=1274662 RepID=A0ABP1FZ68_9CHLO